MSEADNMDMPMDMSEEDEPSTPFPLGRVTPVHVGFDPSVKDEDKVAMSNPFEDDALLVIGPRQRSYVLIFGKRYDLRRPDEGTPADQTRARTLGNRIASYMKKPNPSDADIQNLTRDARELIPILLPAIEEATVKFLRMSELAAIASAWTQAYGEERE